MLLKQSAGTAEVDVRNMAQSLYVCVSHIAMALWMCVHRSLGKTSLWERKLTALCSVAQTKSPGQLLCCRSKLCESTASEAALVLTLEDNSSSLAELEKNEKWKSWW